MLVRGKPEEQKHLIEAVIMLISLQLIITCKTTEGLLWKRHWKILNIFSWAGKGGQTSVLWQVGEEN